LLSAVHSPHDQQHRPRRRPEARSGDRPPQRRAPHPGKPQRGDRSDELFRHATAETMMPARKPMSTTLGEARDEARRLFHGGDYARALRAYEQILAAVPLDAQVRFKIADILAKVGLNEEAAEVYRILALHGIRTGHPLPAIVAC